MKAICVTSDRELEVRDIPLPVEPAPGHLLVEMAASAINHGDRTFLKMPRASGMTLALGEHAVWGASGAGKVIAVGAGVPIDYAGSQVAIYRSLSRSPESIGLWCERAHVPYTTSVILPDHVAAKDYCGSLVNIITAYAYLEEIVEEGHKAVIVTAGSSATGYALASLANSRKIPAIFLVRSDQAQAALRHAGAEHVIVTDEGFTDELGALAARLEATAVFDGVGGVLMGKIAACLPLNSTIHCYGFLGGDVPMPLFTALLMMRNVTIKRFSNFESPTVKNREKLLAALKALNSVIADPLFATKSGEEFRLDQIDLAMAYKPLDGSKAVLLF